MQLRKGTAWKNRLAAAALITALGLSYGCGRDLSYPEYQFDGDIGKEHVRYDEHGFFTSAIIEVTREDGTIIRYTVNTKSERHEEHFERRFRLYDLRIEESNGTTLVDSGNGCVKITEDGETTSYCDDDIKREIMESAQDKVDCYLEKILEIKQGEMNDVRDVLELGGE